MSLSEFVCLYSMRIRVTKKFLFLAINLFLLAYSYSDGQRINIEEFVLNQDSLIENARRYYLRKMESEMTEYAYQEKGKWLKFMPRLGFSLTRFTPIADYDTRLLYEAKNDRIRKDAKLQSIQKKNELAFQETANSLKSLYRLLLAKINFYNAYLSVDDLKAQHMAIIEQQYQNAEIPPTQYLLAKITVEEQKIRRIQEYNTILELAHQLTELAKAQEALPLVPNTLP